MMRGAVLGGFRRFLWRHLAVMFVGVLAGFIVGCNRRVVQQSLDMVLAQNRAPAPHVYDPDGQKPVRAAIVALVRNSDLFGMRSAMRQLEDRFNSKHNYPYIFVNDEPFTDEFKRGVQDVTRAQVHFGTLDRESWKIPEWIDRERYEQVKRDATYPHGKKDSYRKMCRFQSGFLHHHPLLRDLDYYWRIEPDVEYYCNIEYDPFVFMKQHGIKYGWNIAMAEFMDTVKTLWSTTADFIASHPHLVAPGSIHRQWLLNGNGEYNGCHFWSNFEIVDLSFYRSSAYQQYFDHLDRAGGFFYERWGDAPVHSTAAALFLNASQIHYFDDIGYFHPSVLSCPRGARTRGSCVCDETKSFVQNGKCTVLYKQARQAILSPDSPEPAHKGPVNHVQAGLQGML